MRFIKKFLAISILLLAMINTGCGKQPSIDIEKWTNGDDADSAPGPEISVGDLVTWTYMVTNTGSSTLENIQVTDDKGLVPQYLSGDDNRDNIMQVGEKWTYQATGTATEGQYRNVGTVTGKYKSKVVTDSDSAFYLGGAHPSIDIEKATNGQDSDTPPGLGLPVGSDVTWTYSVTNTGNVDLTDVAVLDDDPLISPTILSKGDGDDLLEVGETWTYRATGKAIQGQYSNAGSAEAWHNATKVTDVDLSHYFGTAPGIDLEKLVNGADADSAPGPSVASGANVTFSFIVRNTGNVTL
ncbi:MAG: hypothetical protein KBB09_02255, partial [Firmicutes bacterium]|nr:hypothetical protein [Bacillota bacterium]